MFGLDQPASLASPHMGPIAFTLASPSTCFLCPVHSHLSKFFHLLRHSTKPIFYKNSSQHSFVFSFFPSPSLPPFILSPLLSHTQCELILPSPTFPWASARTLEIHFSLLWNRIHVCTTSQLETTSLVCKINSFLVHLYIYHSTGPRVLRIIGSQ